MASSEVVQCGQCSSKAKSKKADIWCDNCEKGLCASCSMNHRKSKLTLHHKTVTIETYIKIPKFIRSTSTECFKHRQLLISYCPNHLRPCCKECISSDHTKCTGIESLKNILEKTNVGDIKQALEKDSKTILCSFDKISDKILDNMKKRDNQYKIIKESAKQIRKEVNAQIDRLETRLFKEVDILMDRENVKTIDFKNQVHEEKHRVEEIVKQLQMVETHHAKMQTFLAVHEIEQQLHQYQLSVQDKAKHDTYIEFEISVKYDKMLEQILSSFRLLESFGNISVCKQESSNTDMATFETKEAQAQTREQTLIHKMSLKLESKSSIKGIKTVSDMICLIDGRFVVVEENGRISLHSADGKFQKYISVTGKAFSVERIDHDTIITSYPDEKAIKFIKISSETVTKVITLDKPCRGISYCNDTIVVALSHNDDEYKEIRKINLKGNTLSSMYIQSESNLYYLTHSNDRVFFSDYIDDAVRCIDMSGNPIWEFKCDEMNGPCGLCKDNYGNIFVVAFVSGNIVVMSVDGEQSKVMFTDNDIISEPQCICFNNKDRVVSICHFKGEYLANYKVLFK
ncbi:TRIM56 [Mytilus coruscus]|uniref:TRIM56 n=1 Tax=Mytilus coruscus TaxID=42192 RepID=A0A6J8E9U8_MYTCO|nr:TRIM56 [Mytilus coruscus]